MCALSILPPVMTHTIGPSAFTDKAPASAVAPAPSATTRLNSNRIRMALATADNEDTTDPSSMRCVSGHISGSTDKPPIPDIKLGLFSTATGRPASNAAVKGVDISLSAARTRVSGFSARTAEAIPLDTPPPPNGTTIVSTSGRSCRISTAMVAFPAMAAGSHTAST